MGFSLPHPYITKEALLQEASPVISHFFFYSTPVNKYSIFSRIPLGVTSKFPAKTLYAASR